MGDGLVLWKLSSASEELLLSCIDSSSSSVLTLAAQLENSELWAENGRVERVLSAAAARVEG